LADMSSVEFAPSAPRSHIGYLLFLREGALMAQRFDARAARVSGDAFPVAEDIGFNIHTVLAPVTVSDNGVLVYWSVGKAVPEQSPISARSCGTTAPESFLAKSRPAMP